MILKDTLIPFINFGIVAVLLIATLIGVFKGFIKQFLGLLSFVVALVVSILFSPVLARFFIIYKLRVTAIANSEILKIVNYRLNTIIWFVLLFIGISLLLMVVKLLINTLGDLPVLKLFNRFLGGCFGFIQGLVLLVIFSMVLSNAFFLNGSEFKQKTFFRQFDIVSSNLISYVAKTLDENEAVQNFVRDPSSVTDSQRLLVEKWLMRNGYGSEEISEIFNSVDQESQ